MNPRIPDYNAVYNGPNLDYCASCQTPASGAGMGLTTMPMENNTPVMPNVSGSANMPQKPMSPAVMPMPLPQKPMPPTAMPKSMPKMMPSQAPMQGGMGSMTMTMPGGMQMPSAMPSGMMPSAVSPLTMPGMQQGGMGQGMEQSIAQSAIPQGPMTQGSIAQGLLAQGLISQQNIAPSSPMPAPTTAPTTDLTSTPAALLAPITPTTQVMPLTAESLEYLNGFLRSQVGRRVRVEFLIGTNTYTDRSGLLVGVGANYILLREAMTDDLVACDFYNIKFITFFY